MTPPDGYKRYTKSAAALAGLTVPSPNAWRRYYDPPPNATYVTTLIDMSKAAQKAADSLTETQAQLAIVLIPLPNDIADLEQWAQEHTVDLRDSEVRARYGATRLMSSAVTEDNMPIYRGFFPYTESGDFVDVGLALGAGWDGKNPIPLPHLVSEIIQELHDRCATVARISVTVPLIEDIITYSCGICYTSRFTITGTRSDLDSFTLLHLINKANTQGGLITADILGRRHQWGTYPTKEKEPNIKFEQKGMTLAICNR